MTLQQLEYFNSLAKNPNYTKTASQLHISQPSLSYAIHQLEEELSVKLFIQKGKKLVLSWYGEIFLQYSESCIKTINEGISKIKELNNSNKYSVRLGYFHSISFNYIPALINSYFNSGVSLLPSFHFMMNEQSALIDALKNNSIDLSICPEPHPEVASAVISQQQLYLAVSKSNPLCKLDKVDLSIVNQQPLIILNKSTSIRKFLEDLFEKYDLHPNYAFEANNCETQLTYVSFDQGIAITPRLDHMTTENIHFIKLDYPYCRRSIYLCWNKGQFMSPAVSKIKDFILNHPEIFDVFQ